MGLVSSPTQTNLQIMNKKILEKLVSFNTISDQSNLDLIEYVKKRLGRSGYNFIVQKFGNKANLFVFKNTTNPRIIFSSHTDTVPNSIEWRSNPFILTQKSNRYFGLGVSDMKTQVAISIGLLEKFKKLDNLAILLTFNEETDFAGAKKIDSGIIGKNDTIIIGEPTSGRAIFETKGLASFKIIFNCPGGHGSEPKNKMSAIIQCVDFIGKLSRKFDNFANHSRNNFFENPLPTINFGKIAGGDAPNKIAQKCELIFEVRYCNDGQLDKIDSIIKTCIKSLKTKLEILEIARPFKSSDFIKSKFSKTPCARGVSFATEASIFQDLCKNIIILGPGDLSQAHKPNESIDVKGITNYQWNIEEVIKTSCQELDIF